MTKLHEIIIIIITTTARHTDIRTFIGQLTHLIHDTWDPPRVM